MTPQGIAILILMAMAAALGYLVGSSWRIARDALSGTDWRQLYGREQHRADKWRTLFERQRRIDELSVAASRHEQHDIDRQARVLGLDAHTSTRRAEP